MNWHAARISGHHRGILTKKRVARLPNLPLISCLSFFTDGRKELRRACQPTVTSKEYGR